MKPESYERTLRARAFDISRYLLPLATNTSLGEIVNARTLETQVAHLLSQPHKEVRDLGALLKQAALSPAYNANEESLRALVAEIRRVSPEIADRAERELLREVRVAPTLVKYADPNRYEIETRHELQQAAAELMRDAAIEPAPLVDLLDNDSQSNDALEIELATTLLYGHCHYSYRQLRKMIEAAGEARRREVIDLGLRHRGATTRCHVRSPLASSSASISSWISVAFATCTATVAASRLCRISPPHTASTRRPKSKLPGSAPTTSSR